ncbi:MAG: methylenetetrahydrofolate--tRNA-(uracil(54)-C(5))-methyltransferase (FADH(2)-oxidizing) TrmFO [Clostridia bacterium]|nr:methylenetetrahydrofolate--tRNA-(uracil(54)-C(5))-methyltransferase (FADH(2)-oxidizing) TrmFO [Clostridia bacterium]
MNEINVIGAGLAGSEAAWQAACRGVKVRLFEMKPKKLTPAHHYNGFAELVCSNSLRSNQVFNAVGLLKEELRRLGSIIMEAAYACEVPAGGALAVDRYAFSDYITEKLRSHENITVIEDEVTELPDGITVVATGPLTSDKLSESISRLIGRDYLHFFDAAAPIVDASTIDMGKAFVASRYDRGEAAYINCPFTKEEYEAFYNALVSAEEAEIKEFDKESQEKLTVFEGCMPVEVMAKRGFETLLFGPLKPVGLVDPKTGREPYAVVQLRAENLSKTMYNLVGFQTHLKFGEQKRVFSMIPGLENAEFLRYGVMHRNTFINSPGLLAPDYSMVSNDKLFFAGQMTGVEGYVESCASGFVAGLNAAHRALGKPSFIFDTSSIIGSMAAYISDPTVVKFQPMNANFGLIKPFDTKIRGGKKGRADAAAARSLEYIDSLELGGEPPRASRA